VLAAIVQEAISEHFDQGALADQIVREHDDRTALLRALPAGSDR
jgi:hypothetical protein